MGAFASGGSGGSNNFGFLTSTTSGANTNITTARVSAGSALAFHNIWFDASWWGNNATWDRSNITKANLDDLVSKTIDQMRETFNRYRIFDVKFTNAEVIASKLLASQLCKTIYEFAVSKKLSSGKRNAFLILQLMNSNSAVLNPETFDVGPGKDKYIVDLCAEQYGNFPVCSLVTDNPPEHWDVEFSYKTPVSLVKRLIKEGRDLKYLSLKDAIALSTRYEVSNSKDTCLDTRVINPSDIIGKKFLEKFGKEVGFKTTLAQLLLDTDPIVAEKAQIIAQIIMQR